MAPHWRQATYLILDTETTGMDPETDAVCELALVKWHPGHMPIRVFETFIKPGRPIPPEASAIHHITDAMVADAPTWPTVWETVIPWIQQADIIVAHNADFDRQWLPGTDRPWLCSLRLTRHVWPNAPRHSNQFLRYWLGLTIDADQPHRAGDDAWVTAHVLARALEDLPSDHQDDDLNTLITWVDSPIFVPTMPFGKHRQQTWDDIPTDYLRWVLSNVRDLTPDLRWTIQTVLARRHTATPA